MSVFSLFKLIFSFLLYSKFENRFLMQYILIIISFHPMPLTPSPLFHPSKSTPFLFLIRIQTTKLFLCFFFVFFFCLFCLFLFAFFPYLILFFFFPQKISGAGFRILKIRSINFDLVSEISIVCTFILIEDPHYCV